MKKQTNTNTGGPAFECVTSSTNPMTTQERFEEREIFDKKLSFLQRFNERFPYRNNNSYPDGKYSDCGFGDTELFAFIESEKSIAVEEYREKIRKEREKWEKSRSRNLKELTYQDGVYDGLGIALSDTLELL